MQQDKWSEDDFNPIEDINKAKELIKNSCSTEPNAILITEQGKKFIKDTYGIDVDRLRKDNNVI